MRPEVWRRGPRLRDTSTVDVKCILHNMKVSYYLVAGLKRMLAALGAKDWAHGQGKVTFSDSMPNRNRVDVLKHSVSSIR